MLSPASCAAACCAFVLALSFPSSSQTQPPPSPRAPADSSSPAAADAPPPTRFKPPVLVERVEAKYPEQARKDGVTGTVLLQLVVGTDGRVSDAKVARPAGHGFDEAAMEAARTLRFEPATQEGQPVQVQINYEVQFQLKDAELPTLRDTAGAARSEKARAPYEAIVEGERPFTAASASTVRDRDFLLRPRFTPEDILRSVPGLVIAQHQGGGKADQLFLRGFDSDHGTDVAVSLDGVPVNMPSHAHGQGFADLHFLIPEVLSAVEITKGPYFADKGDFDTAGAINLVTRDRFDHSQITVQGGLLPSELGKVDGVPGSTGRRGLNYRVLGVASPEIGDVRPFFAGEVSGLDGPFQTSEKLERYNFFSKAGFDLSPRTRLSLLASAYASSWYGSGQIPSRLVDAGVIDRYGAIDPTEGGDTQRQQAILNLVTHPDNQSSLSLTGSYIRYNLTLYNDFTFFARNPDGDEIEQDDNRTVLWAATKYERRDKDLLPGAVFTTFGFQFRNDEIYGSLYKVKQRVRRQMCNDVVNPCVNTLNHQTDAAGYLQEEWRPNRFFRLIGGIRTDLFVFDVKSLKPGFGFTPDNPDPQAPVVQRSIQSPKASVVVSPIDQLDLYFNFGSGFHSNHANSAIPNNGDGALPRALGYEVGARTRLLGNKLELGTALWRLDLASELTFNGDEGGVSPNGATRRYGVDFEARYQILPWLFFDGDLTLSHSTFVHDSGNGLAVALSPPVIATGGLTVRHPSGIQASLRMRHIGTRPGNQFTADDYLDPSNPSLGHVIQCNPSLDANNLADPKAQRCYLVADGYTVFDAAVTYETKRYAITLIGENLLGSVYREAQFGNVSQVTQLLGGRTTGANGQPFIPETHAVQDIHYTPGNPFGLQAAVSLFF
jgi:TonB family protein